MPDRIESENARIEGLRFEKSETTVVRPLLLGETFDDLCRCADLSRFFFQGYARYRNNSVDPRLSVVRRYPK